LINTVDSMPLHIYAEFGQMEVTKNLVWFRCCSKQH
jgi:hypothetical protein